MVDRESVTLTIQLNADFFKPCIAPKGTTGYISLPRFLEKHLRENGEKRDKGKDKYIKATRPLYEYLNRELDGKEYILMSEEDILAVIE